MVTADGGERRRERLHDSVTCGGDFSFFFAPEILSPFAETLINGLKFTSEKGN